MTIRPPDPTRTAFPDGAVAVAGEDGDIVLQTNRRIVTREGATAEDANFVFTGQDVTTDPCVANPDNVGGTSNIVLNFKSQQDREFDVKVELQDGEGETVIEYEPEKWQGITEIFDDSISVGADNLCVEVSDASGEAENLVDGLINIHSGGPSGVDTHAVPTSVSGNANEAAVEFRVAGRVNTVFYYNDVTEEGGEIDIEWSADGETWRPFETIDTSDEDTDSESTEQFPWVGVQWLRADATAFTNQVAVEFSSA